VEFASLPHQRRSPPGGARWPLPRGSLLRLNVITSTCRAALAREDIPLLANTSRFYATENNFTPRKLSPTPCVPSSTTTGQAMSAS